MISYAAAVLAAVANAASNVLNRKVTREEPARVEFRVRLLLDLLRRPAWLTAVAIMLVSFVLGTVALGTGQLAAVQIIIVLELPMTLIGAKFLGSRLGPREWAAVAGMTGAVVGLVACLYPRPGPVPAITPAEWIMGTAATAGPALVLFLIARRARSPGARAGALGLATGLGYGLAAAYTKGMTERFTAAGITGVLTSWQLYAAAAAGIAATWLLQNAYHAGRLAAAQPGITLLDPAAATVWGIAVFGERVRSGFVLLLTLLPIAALAGSMLLLSRSPVLHAAAAADESTNPRSGSPGDQDAGQHTPAVRWFGERVGFGEVPGLQQHPRRPPAQPANTPDRQDAGNRRCWPRAGGFLCHTTSEHRHQDRAPPAGPDTPRRSR